MFNPFKSGSMAVAILVVGGSVTVRARNLTDYTELVVNSRKRFGNHGLLLLPLIVRSGCFGEECGGKVK